MKHIFTALFIIVFLTACGEERTGPSLSSQDKIEEELLDGSISGVVLDSIGDPIPGIAITTTPGGYTSTSDFRGEFILPKVEMGVYSIVVEGGLNFRDTTLNDVRLLEDQDLSNIIIKIHAELDSLSEQNIEDVINSLKTRNIVGSLTGEERFLKNVFKLEVFHLAKEGDTTQANDLLLSNNNFSTTIAIPEAINGKVIVKVYDLMDRLLAYHEKDYIEGDAIFNLGELSASNGIPRTSIQGNLNPTSHTSVTLHAKILDTIGLAHTYQWTILGTNIELGSSIDSSIVLEGFSLAEDLVTVRLKATDLHGNSSQDTIIFGKQEFVDQRDNEIYKQITIGSQTWMAENLRYATSTVEGRSYCYDQETHCESNGRLYTWSKALNLLSDFDNVTWVEPSTHTQGLCPLDWHIPQRTEWETLLDFISQTNPTVSKTGTLLMKNESWNDLTDVLDAYGFSATGAGYAKPPYSTPLFEELGNFTRWWTTGQYNSTLGSVVFINSFSKELSIKEVWGSGPEDLEYYSTPKDNFSSIRCIKN